MPHVACGSKLCLVVRSSMHPCPENCVGIRHTVVYYDLLENRYTISFSWSFHGHLNRYLFPRIHKLYSFEC